MTSHTCEIYIEAPPFELDSSDGVALLDALGAAGLDDATVADIRGEWVVLIDHVAPSYVDAVMSAVATIESVPECAVLRVEPEDLVSAGEIAARCRKTRQWVHQRANGSRGAGDFPNPFYGAGGMARWRWADIERYIAADASAGSDDLQAEAVFLEALNAALALRNRMRRLDDLSRSRDAQRVVEAVLRETLGPAA